MPLVGSSRQVSEADTVCSLGLLDHGLGNPVFDAASGVLPLQLGVYVHVLIGVETLQLHQWRIADGIQNALLYARTHPTRAVAGTFHVVSFIQFCRSVLAAGMLVRRQATEYLIVDQFSHRRVVAAQRAVGVPPQLHLAELHRQGIYQQQAGCQ